MTRIRNKFAWAIAFGLCLLALAIASPGQTEAAPGDTTADRVFGQAGSFTAGVCNQGATVPSAGSLCGGGAAALDAAGNLYVADYTNNRVLEYNTPLTTDTVADRVFGQGGSFTSGSHNPVISASSLYQPVAVAVDAAGNLYVADFGNNRVLEYNTPLSTDTVADRVFGQAGSFTTNTINNGGISATSLWNPYGVTVDAAGNLYVLDQTNQRVLEYNTPLTTDTVADRVFGQANSFSTNTINNGGISASSLKNPQGVTVDAAGNLYVADVQNHRVLEYNTPLTTDTVADRVFGQGGIFTTNLPNNGGISASSLFNPTGVAVDAAGNLYVADYSNDRVLEYNTPLTTGTVADRVFGQSNFTSGTFVCNNGGLSATSLCAAGALTVDAAGNLYVADANNNRMLEYDTPLGSTITVNTTTDETTVDGNCSLREAISAANTNTAVDACTAGIGADTIVVPAGTYILPMGELGIMSDLTINGAGVASTIIDGAVIHRVINIFPLAAVTISGVTIQNGMDPIGGGGIYNGGGTLTLTNSKVSGNSALVGPIGGGGIYNGGMLTLTNSTVSGNSTLGGGGGGGIYNDFSGTLTVSNSSVIANSATDAGGGIYDLGPMTVANSTVSGNSAVGGTGGGIYIDAPVAVLTNSTVSGNAAADGGGIYNDVAGPATLKNTIVANNEPLGLDCGGIIMISLGHNLVSDPSCPFSGPGDLLVPDPMLGPLANNGGPTQTQALLTGSPAIDAGSSDCPPYADQRGVTRPQDGNGDGIAICDIGAFELSPLTSTPIEDAAAGQPAPGGGTFDPGMDLGINNSGQAVFQDTVSSGSSSGLYLFFAGQPVQSLALQGQPAPSTNGAFSTFGPPVNNNNGQAAARATLSGSASEGLFLFFAGQPAVKLAAQGDPAVGGVGGTFSSFGNPALNNTGQVAARATISGGSASEGLFLFFAGQPAVKLAAKGDPALGGTISSFSDPLINDQGQVAAVANIAGGTASQGLFLFFAGSPATKLAAQGDPALGGTISSFGDPTINFRGQVAAVANITGGTASQGLFLFFAGSPLTRLAAQGDPALGGTISGFSNALINDNGVVVVRATISGGTATEGLFLFFAGLPASRIVAQGDPAAGGGTYSGFTAVALNRGDQVVFVANVSGGPASQGVFFASLDVDGDGLLDYQDNCPLVFNPVQNDGDADGAGNACDNCLTVPNAGQADWNHDAIGDACQESDGDSLGQTTTSASGPCSTGGTIQAKFRDCIEVFIGTDPGKACAVTTTANDEAVEPMPADLNDDRSVNVTDRTKMVLQLKAYTANNITGYKKRYDLNADSKIDVLDRTIVALYIKQTGGLPCTP